MAQNKTNKFEADILRLIFNGATIANIADNAATSPATEIYVALFTASPNEQASFASEATYTGYARVGVARDNGQWVVTESTDTAGGITGATETTGGAVVQNAATITFGACTAGSETITHVGICKSLSGTTSADLLYAGALNTSLAVSVGVTPQFAANALKVYEY